MAATRGRVWWLLVICKPNPGSCCREVLIKLSFRSFSANTLTLTLKVLFVQMTFQGAENECGGWVPWKQK